MKRLSSLYLVATLLFCGCAGVTQAPPSGALPMSIGSKQLERERRAAAPGTSSSPLIYICDSNGVLWTLTTDGTQLQEVGSIGTVLTEIAFNPRNDKLYGVSYTDFYKIHLGGKLRVTDIGATGMSGATALTFGASGKAYAAEVTTTDLYSVDAKTGIAQLIGANGTYAAAGALTFYDGKLVLSGMGGKKPDTLVWLDPRTARAKKTVGLKLANIWGLVTTGEDTLYGFSGTSFYQIIPQAKPIEDRTVLIVDLASLNSSIGTVYGAAYDPNL